MARIVLLPTPIGNLGDITLRALEVLKACDAVAAEDTRHTGQLLKHYGVDKPLVSLHAHNEHQRVHSLLERVLREGLQVAVVSDAGTPAISDPGFLIVREALAMGIEVECLPGATAFVPALVASGLPCDRFTFEGFLPVKKGRQTRLTELKHEKRTMIFYESPHKLLRTLEDLALTFDPERAAAVAREITKLHEEYRRGSLAELITYYRTQTTIRGEIVLIVAGQANTRSTTEVD
jgi:16S rRNA (cytidine1402-2'-O)-methyltransferase